MPASYHVGFEGSVVANAIDWHVKSWNYTETVDFVETTNTGDYDPVTDRAYETGVRGKSRMEGEFNFGYDSNNQPEPSLVPGSIVAAVFTKLSGVSRSLNIYITSLRLGPGDIAGQVDVTCSFRNNGKWSDT